MIEYLLNNKPVLVGLHLGAAILAIDLFLWLAGEIIAKEWHRRRMIFVAVAGTVFLLITWLIGGYYYVKYYGSLVKPGIVAGAAPWAHAVSMEAKEHIFLFALPIALTLVFLSFVGRDKIENAGLKKSFLILTFLLSGVALSLGLMGYIISAAARWGA